MSFIIDPLSPFCYHLRACRAEIIIMAPLAGGSRSDLWGSSSGLLVNLSPHALLLSSQRESDGNSLTATYMRIIDAGPDAFACALLAIMLSDLPHEQGCLLVKSLDSWKQNSLYTIVLLAYGCDSGGALRPHSSYTQRHASHLSHLSSSSCSDIAPRGSLTNTRSCVVNSQ